MNSLIATDNSHPGTPDLASYDRVIVGFSGGKDSLACLLRLLDLGVSRDRIELWHHDVGDTFDWPVTRAYCQAVADELGLPLYFSGRAGGLDGEIARLDAETAQGDYWTDLPGGGRATAAHKARKPQARGRFPALSANLQTRWCSAWAKIDVCSWAIRQRSDLDGLRTLVVTGERAQESSARAKYATFEPHRTDCGKRTVHAWRPVHAWSEDLVWAVIRKHRLAAHPAYYLGWGRTSCITCIFGSASQWATIREIAPEKFQAIRDLEALTGHTLQDKKTIDQVADRGQVYPQALDADAVSLALGTEYSRAVRLDIWALPAGAYGESNGPT